MIVWKDFELLFDAECPSQELFTLLSMLNAWIFFHVQSMSVIDVGITIRVIVIRISWHFRSSVHHVDVVGEDVLSAR